MKNTPFFPLGSALIVTAMLLYHNCTTGVAPKGSTIEATVRNFSTDSTMADVVVVTKTDKISEYDTTTSTGTCTLSNVSDKNTYSFEKTGYVTQVVIFEDFANLTALEVYLKTGNSTDTTNLCGKVKNASDKPVGNVTVSCNGDTTKSMPDGSYSFNVSSRDSTFPITYSKDGTGARVRVNTPQDTIEVDVFIDGINPDTLSQKG